MSETRRGRDRGPSSWPLLLALVLIVAALATLLWLRERLVEGQESTLEGTVRRFEATGVLGRPESDAIVFAEVEVLARSSENELIRELRVTKSTLGRGEVTVVPFAADLAEPDWRSREGWSRRVVGDPPVGYLYMRVNDSTIRAVNGSIAALATLLAAGLGILLARQRGKEAQVTRLQDELEERKAQLIRVERLALAGQLSANVFHDIKKPVLNIKHEVGDALESGNAPDAEVLRNVRAQTELFLQMLRELGMETFVNSASEQSEWCDLHEALERAQRLVRYEQENVDVTVDFPPDQDFLMQGFPHRFVQLFSNLLMNAYQAMEGRGKLKATGRREGNRITITIEDSGPGIPEDAREAVFQPFHTTRIDSGGSGLGLFISKTIVEDSGGKIRIDRSETLGGAQFVIGFATTAEEPK